MVDVPASHVSFRVCVYIAGFFGFPLSSKKKTPLSSISVSEVPKQKIDAAEVGKNQETKTYNYDSSRSYKVGPLPLISGVITYNPYK